MFYDFLKKFIFIKYLCVSIVCLIIDYTFYFCFYKILSIDLSLAASLGYILGLTCSYILMTQRVFKKSWLKKNVEVLLFALSGFFGVLTTYLTVYSYNLFFGEHVHLAKLSAVIISFISVYLIRRYIIFKEFK